jgi:hypothetical protein
MGFVMLKPIVPSVSSVPLVHFLENFPIWIYAMTWKEMATIAT